MAFTCSTYPWLLKGGYAMELRMHAARTAKDIDLTLYDGARLSMDPGEQREQIRALLQEFLVGEGADHVTDLASVLPVFVFHRPGNLHAFPRSSKRKAKHFTTNSLRSPGTLRDALREQTGHKQSVVPYMPALLDGHSSCDGDRRGKVPLGGDSEKFFRDVENLGFDPTIS
jgi:Nucleotidyl transferase AbiEii toxin, Type IV TA system